MRSVTLTLILTFVAVAADAATIKDTIDRTFEVKQGARVSLENTNGKVVVRGWDQPRVRVIAEKIVERSDASEARQVMANLKVDIQQQGSNITIRTLMPRSDTGFLDAIFGNWSNASVSYEISVPRSAMVDVDNTNGSLNVSDVAGGLEVETTNGSVTLTRCGGAVEAATTNGRISADLAGALRPSRFETTNGRIEVTVPASAKLDIDADTTNGNIESDLPVLTRSVGRTSLRGSINGGGGATMTLRTTNGAIRIHGSNGSATSAAK